MGKVTAIKKSRKEFKCSRCGKIIPKGSSYFRGEVNFGPTIIRCSECNLYPYEVTTSDYQIFVGDLQCRLTEQIDIYSEDCISDIISLLEDKRSEIEEKIENMEQSFSGGEVLETLHDRVECLESAVSNLESLDIDDIKSEAAEIYISASNLEDSESYSYEMLIGSTDHSDAIQEVFSTALCDAINESICDL